jgi:hypothetical protein
MNNEYDDDDKRPFSERMKDGSYKLPPEAAKLDGLFKEDERMRHALSNTPPA